MNNSNNITDVHTNSTLICYGMRNINFKITTIVIAVSISTAVVNSVFAIFATATNMLSLVVLCKTVSLRTPSNLLLASMSLTDFLVGLLVQPLCVTLRAAEMQHKQLCSVKMAYAFIGYVCSGASMLTLCFISVDHWFAITMPYRYIPEVLYNRYIVTVALMWVTWLSFTLLLFTKAIPYRVFFLCLSAVMFVSVTISVSCNIVIFKIVRDQSRRISANIPRAGPQDVAHNRKKDGGRNASQILLRNQRRRSLTCAIIVVVFIACYVPKLVELILNFVKGDSLELSYICAKLAETCLFINSSLNPVIYVLRISGIRLEIIRVLQSVRTTVVNMKILSRDS